MKRLNTFIIFLILVAVWAGVFASLKLFLWGEMSDTIAPDLQKIAGYLSLGGVFAYLIGGAFAVTFLKKYFLFIISILSFLFISILYFVDVTSSFVFAIIISMVGFLYGLWNIVKNVLISVEIKKTGLSETAVNGIVGIIFVVFIIVGSLFGSILFEQFGHQGYLAIMGMLFFTAVISLTLNYDKVGFKDLIRNGWSSYFCERSKSLKKAMKLYIPDLKYIIKNYYLIMLVSSLLWTVSTIVSQASIENSVERFDIEASKATFVLLYSAVGAIIGNIISFKMNKQRFKFFLLFNTLFAVLVIFFGHLSVSFNALIILAVFLGAFFGVSSNLIDSYLLKRIGDEDKKEYGSSTYGLLLSIIIVIMMFVSSSIVAYAGYNVLMFVLGIMMFIVGLFLYREQR